MVHQDIVVEEWVVDMEKQDANIEQVEIITFYNTKELYDFLEATTAIESLDIFFNTPIDIVPKDNLGYAIIVDDLVVGAASIYEEDESTIFNELFEIRKEYRGQGLARVLYEYIKEDTMCERVHGFCTNDENQSFWEHMGQKCIDQEKREMLEIVYE